MDVYFMNICININANKNTIFMIYNNKIVY